MGDGSVRYAGRVLLFDRTGRILLLRTAFADAGRVPHWLTPGGGAEPGERPHDTAVRELAEETGLVVTDLGDIVATIDFPVNRPTARHSFAHWDFFRHVVEAPFEPSPAAWTAAELIDITGARWWTLAELVVSGESYAPPSLPRLIAEQRPVDLSELLEEAEAQPSGLDVPAFTSDDAVELGLLALRRIRALRLGLAVRIVLRGDEVFLAKPDGTGPGNDPWLAGKAAVAELTGEASYLARLRAETAGTSFAAQHPELDPEGFRAYGGSFPIRVGEEVVGTLTLSGEPDAVDHAVGIAVIEAFGGEG